MGNNASKPEDDVCFEGKFFTTGDGIKLSSSVVKRLSQDEREAKEHRAKLEAQAKVQAEERAQKSADPNYISPFSGHQNNRTQITHDSKQFFSEGPNFNKYKSSFCLEPNDIYRDQFQERDFKSEANVNPCFDDPKTTCDNEQPTTCHPIPNIVVSDAPSPITTSRPSPKLVGYEKISDEDDVSDEVTSPTLFDQIGQDAIDQWRRDLNAMKEVFDCEDPSNPYDGTSSQFEPFTENYRASVPDEKNYSPVTIRLADEYLKPYVPSIEVADRKPKICRLNEDKASADAVAHDPTYFPVRAPPQQCAKPEVVDLSDDDTNLIDIEDLEQQEGDFHPGEHEMIMGEGDGGEAKEEPVHRYEVADIFTKDPLASLIEDTCPAPADKERRTPLCEVVNWEFDGEESGVPTEFDVRTLPDFYEETDDKIKKHRDWIRRDYDELEAELDDDEFTKSYLAWKAEYRNGKKSKKSYSIAPEMAEAMEEVDELYRRMYGPDEDSLPPKPSDDELMIFSIRTRELQRRQSKDKILREDDDDDDDEPFDLQTTTAIASPDTNSDALFELKHPVHQCVEENEACNWRNVNSFTTIAHNNTVNTFDENFCKEQEASLSRRNWHTSVEGHVDKFDDLTPLSSSDTRPRSWSNHIIKQFAKTNRDDDDQDDETKKIRFRRSVSKQRRSTAPKKVEAFTPGHEQLEADPTGLSSTKSQESSVDGAEFFSKKSLERLKKNRVSVLKESSDLEQISTVAYQEFEDAAKKIEEKFQPAGSKAVCSDTESSLLECYKTNPRKPLLCNKQLQHFKECVAASKKEMFARRGLASE